MEPGIFCNESAREGALQDLNKHRAGSACLF